MNTVEIRTDGPQMVTVYARSSGETVDIAAVVITTTNCDLAKGKLLDDGGIRITFKSDPLEGHWGPCSKVVTAITAYLGWDSYAEVVCRCHSCVMIRAERRQVTCVGDK